MISIDDFNPEYKSHKRAKRMKLRYDAANDRAVITVPPFTSNRTARKFAQGHVDWLLTQRNSSPTNIYLAPGETIPFKGIDKLILHDEERSGRVTITEDTIIVGGSREGFSVRLENFLKKQARIAIEPLAQEMAHKLDKSFKRIQIRDTKSRWGSCSSSGNISLSWRLIMTPPDILEYVVAHEISHLQEMNHSPAFWDVVDCLVINAKPSRKWLKSKGQELMLVLPEPL
ncbi:MAG: SprT family zinc-dependent metalloprotease [Emcibacteraceae bacterium]|nr:SprT family zinc-dependent metalloprotease [Emcibacteraceae bacterium]